MMLRILILGFSLVVGFASGAVTPCINSATSRQCWTPGYNISTDAETRWPNTGKVVKYHLEITNTTLAPDGTPKRMMVVNGCYPGPTITADWGDTLEITVTNRMQDNGTSIHWHGISQKSSNNMDGVNGVTECPIPPGHSKTYTFVANEHGTTWYHSHFSAQYGDGVQGPIVINGPATANYDVDLGAMPISDLYYQSAWQEAYLASHGGPPPTANNGVINGTMVNPAGTAGSYNKVTLIKGKTYRLRLINTSMDNHFKVSLDSHTMKVIEADYVPIKPYSADWIFIGIGQRYDVIITASEKIDNYWFRAEPQAACGANANSGNIKSIFSYKGAASSNPTTTATAYVEGCADETQLVPYVVKNVPAAEFVYPNAKELVVGGPTFITPGSGTSASIAWTINGTAINVNWEQPTLEYIYQGNTNYPTDLNLYQLPHDNAWSFFIIEDQNAPFSVTHPIHLHGHDFYVLGAGSGAFTSTSQLKFDNPPRRDVAMLPGQGWLVIGFVTDNPGAWLMHCHIAWHVGEGLAVQFLERASEIKSTVNLKTLQPTCSDWDSYYKTSYWKKSDSGL